MNKRKLIDWILVRQFEAYCIGIQVGQERDEFSHYEKHRAFVKKELEKRLKAEPEKEAKK
jgi:hypothetical protein